MKYIFMLMFSFLCFGCKNKDHSHKQDHKHSHGHANEHMNERPFEDLVKNFESPDRTEWQKPDDVLNFIGPLEGKTVMDLGSGTGYFSFRMAERGAQVISADVDERFLDYIHQKKQEKTIANTMIETRKVPYDSPNLSVGEVDIVLTVNTYHHFEDRITYFTKVKSGLKPGGKLVVIDFKKEDTPVGPPMEMKLKAEEIMNELKKAGFDKFSVNKGLLPYQNILTAK